MLTKESSTMGRKKDPDELKVDMLEKQIRILKATNRHLLKRLKKADKGFKYNEFVNEVDSSEEEIESCPNCGKGQLEQSMNIPKRIIITCTLCDFRRIQKIV